MERLFELLPNVIRQARGVHQLLKDEGGFPQRFEPIPILEPINQTNPISIPKVFENSIAGKPVKIYRPDTVTLKAYGVLPAHLRNQPSSAPMVHAGHMINDAKAVSVAYSRELNYCGARYIVCKELSHLLVFEEKDGKKAQEHFCTNSIGDIVGLIDSLLKKPLSTKVQDQTRADLLAYYAAIELLIPSEWVPDLRKARDIIIEKVPAEKATLELATALRVPEKIMEHRLNNSELDLIPSG
ncbi:MAG: ImmA/IrrE family metallo-endopeptidase [Gammaproteobacteria bacterium]|nr:ImmA/IrrE family metallo-endopeptidase [Gammaproteobacteria bacterium]